MRPLHKPLRRQRGISLIELMVGMTLGLLLLTALASLYASTSQSRVQLGNSATQIENGRYALDVISQEIGLAGYLGDLNLLGTSAISTPDVCNVATTALGFTNSPATVPVAIYGYAPGTNPATCLPNLSPSSEILVVRRVSSTKVASPSAITAGQAYLQDSFCTTDTAPFVFSGTSTDFTLKDKTCSNPAELRQVSVRAFYIATCDLCKGNDNGVLTLKVAELSGGAMQPQSIAEGIQDMHFSYGVDVDGNGSPDCYVANPGINNSAACNNVGGYNWNTSATTNWSNVTAVRINVLASTLKPAAGWTDNRTYDLGRGSNAMSGPFNDSYKRHVYVEVARAANVAGPRE
ncbi:type 4 fimbrial biogenesis PilW transmembrane [Ralstonia sp. A12]|uniref:PilW family protein n=1 Tax=Ralstonia sp. A12 TaxID=1217052 RepID=UPI000574CE61|nr:PilW family protein [Ralstonia sp. A12]KHK50650.1 type 4 fimbrial biogenesis PilW transmembrane [Ralstonia sp. A12]